MTAGAIEGLVQLAGVHKERLVAYERSLRDVPDVRAQAIDEWEHPTTGTKWKVQHTLAELAKQPALADTLADLLMSAPSWLEARLHNDTWLGLLNAALGAGASHTGGARRNMMLQVARAKALFRKGWPESAGVGEDLEQVLAAPRSPDTERVRIAALNALGEVQARRGKYALAQELHEQARDIAEAIGDHWLGVEARMNVAIALDEQRETALARAAYLKVLELSDSAAFVDLRVGCLQSLGTLYRLTGELDQAETQHRAQLGLARLHKLVKAEAEALMGIGLIYLSRRDLVPARDALKRSLQKRDAVGDVHGAVGARTSLALALDKLGYGDDAQRLLEEALAYAERHGDPRATGMARNNLFNRAFNAGQFERAQELADLSLAWAKSSGDPVALGMACFAQFRLCEDDDERRVEADDLVARSATKLREGGHGEGFFRARRAQGLRALACENVKLASACFNDCIDTAVKLGDGEGVVQSLIQRSICEILRDSTSGALAILDDAAENLPEVRQLERRSTYEAEIAELRQAYRRDLESSCEADR